MFSCRALASALLLAILACMGGVYAATKAGGDRTITDKVLRSISINMRGRDECALCVLE
jgi:hypothetical protein